MNEYPKIQSVYKRYTEGPNKGKFIIGEWTLPEFEYLKDLMWVWKEKVDGTNIRVQYWGDNTKWLYMQGIKPRVTVKGKTDKAQRIEPLYSIVEKMFPIEWFQEHFDPNLDICLYGEGYGAGIQKGGKYRPDQSFVLFDIKVGHWWLKNDTLSEIATAGRIEYIPTLFKLSIMDAVDMVSEGIQSTWGVFDMEGLVGQPLIPLNMRNEQRVITKIKTKDFVKEN